MLVSTQDAEEAAKEKKLAREAVVKATYEASRTVDAQVSSPAPEQEVVVEAPRENASGKTVNLRGPWTLPEQRLLEDAMRSVAKEDADRWDQIAVKVGRSRRECVQRVKDLAAKVKEAKDAVA